MVHSDLAETPEFIRGIKSIKVTELQRSFQLIQSISNNIGELLWSSVYTSFAYPPDKSGSYSKEILTGFYYQYKLSV